MLTYAFSHYGFFSYRKFYTLFKLYLVFNSIIMASFGRSIINTHGNKIFWLLYLGGAISGGLCMQVFRPNNSIVIP
jgi:membrane associated rhomboid family serine protease